MDKLLALNKFVTDMKIRNFSVKTIESYQFQLSQFIDYCGEVPTSVDVDKIREYKLYLITQKKYGTSAQNVAHTAIQVFFIRILQLEWPGKIVARPKVANKLPEILSFDQVKLLISGITNLKHKAAVSLMYSAGLRVSELINIMPKEIDSKQMFVMVRGGKGKKDRTTLLSENCLLLLREYFKVYRPEKYLFYGAKKNRPYSQSSIEAMVRRAAKKAGITKKVTPHTFRHSFATHLLEGGCNLFYIKELLGHSNIQTTMVYLHLCSKNIRKIDNPFDKMFGDGAI